MAPPLLAAKALWPVNTCKRIKPRLMKTQYLTFAVLQIMTCFWSRRCSAYWQYCYVHISHRRAEYIVSTSHRPYPDYTPSLTSTLLSLISSRQRRSVMMSFLSTYCCQCYRDSRWLTDVTSGLNIRWRCAVYNSNHNRYQAQATISLVNNITTVQFMTKCVQSSVEIFHVIINWVCLQFPA